MSNALLIKKMKESSALRAARQNSRIFDFDLTQISYPYFETFVVIYAPQAIVVQSMNTLLQINKREIHVMICKTDF